MSPNSDCASVRGRSAHQKKIDLFALFQQLPALLDTEAMLLVCHDHAQIVKANLFLKQRMRADDDIDRMIGQLIQDLFLLCRPQGRTQQLDPDLVIRKEPPQAFTVLPGKDLGRGQKRPLFM